MAKDKLTEYSATNASNDVIGDISVAEGMLPSAVNNALREQMTHLKNFADGTDGINVLSLDDDDASASIKIQAPSAVTTTTTLTLPDGDGDAGAMLQTNGSGQLAWSTAYRNRNLILNGSFQVAQRGTSFTDADTYVLDRWRLNQSAETMAVTQQSFAAGQTDVPRAEKYLRVVVTTTGNYSGITQRIEGVEQLSGQTVTVSFYARGGQGGQGVPTTFRTYFNQNFGSGGSTQIGGQGSTNHTLTTSWQLFTATVTLGSTSNRTIGTSSYTELAFQQTTGEACDFDIALVQLEVGEQATPFEHRSYNDELAACQRYYYQLTSQLAYRRYGMSTYDTSTNYSALIPFPVQMRTTPSLSTTGTASDYAVYALNSVKASNAVPSLGDSTVFNALLSGVTASSTAGAAGTLLDNNAAGTFLGFSAEL